MITDYFKKNDDTLEEHNEKEFSGGTSDNYHAFNSGGVESEVGEFFYGLVKLLQPEKVLETGTHHGISSMYIGMALKNNGHGKLTTYEFSLENHNIAVERFKKLGLTSWIDVALSDVAKAYNTKEQYDLIFLDTEPQTRFREMIEFYDNLKPGGYLFVHDLHRHLSQHDNKEHGFGWPYGKLPEEIVNLFRKGLMRPFHFPTPRGLSGFYKVHPEDYRWTQTR